MRAVITVVGRDTVGILAKVSALCVDFQANIIDVTQTVLEDLFAMIMLVDVSGMSLPFAQFKERMASLGQEQNLSIHVMHEDLFNSMHRI
ncbi:MAG: ACT domain-containing protein [Oscillospiraceae bacterium]|jgi:ACT domain-containing protein|nr:ACT domain-containing protein [Oscillospiraceae bacterium]